MARIGVIRCLLAAVLFGASAPTASLLTDDMPSLMLAGLLYLGASLAVLHSVVRKPPSAAALRRDWRPTLVAVIAGGAIGPALLVAGLARTSAASASILLNLELAATVLLAATIFREYLGPRVIAGAGLVTAAGVVLAGETGAEVSLGALLIAGACLAWGVDNGITARIDQLSPEHVVFAKGIVAGSANLCLGIAFAQDAMAVELADIAAAVAIGVAGYGVSIVLWVKGARDLGAARGQVIFAMAPFIGAVIAWTILGEAMSVAQIVAVVIAAAGVGTSLQSAHTHTHSHERMEHSHEHRHVDGHHDHHHDDEIEGSHTHTHVHEPLVHSHPHVPDLHHRHRHKRRPGTRKSRAHEPNLPPIRD